MSSQPDFERARQLAPHIFPPDPRVLLEKAQQKIGYLMQIACKYMNKSEEQVMAEMEEFLTSPNDPAAVAKRAKQQEQEEEQQQKSQTQEGAGFFGHKEKDVYYPIALRNEHPQKMMKEENVRYFATAEEAEAAGYKPQE